MKIIVNGTEAEIPSGGGSSMEVYSTEETRIGTWIDGKPLYRRVYTGVLGATLNTSYKLFSVDEAVERIVKLHGVIYPSWGATELPQIAIEAPYDSVSDISYNAVWYEKGDRSVRNRFNYSGHSGSEYTVTLEYTKTTDQAAPAAVAEEV